jgi:NADH-quinone oxidoreductase subunit J
VTEYLNRLFSAQNVFLVVSAIGLAAALGTVLSRNLVRAALHLVAFFFIIACQFVLLEAEFLAAIQVLVYIGAVAILMMFGIMLTRNVQGDDTTTVPAGWRFPALLVGVGLFAVLVFGINGHTGPKGQTAWSAIKARPMYAPTAEGQLGPPPRAAAINDMGRMVGNEMMTRFALPFEIAGLLLTVALVGAVALAYREGEEDSPQQVARARAGRGPLPHPASGNGTAPHESQPTAPTQRIP